MIKVGDLVKVKKNSPDAMLSGKYGTVKKISHYGCRVFFKKYGEYDISLNHLDEVEE